MHLESTEPEFSLPVAAAGDPGVGVYALTQFVYCPRAGIITAEDSNPDVDEQPEMRRLDYLPRWGLVEIERRLAELFRAGWKWLGVVAGIFVATMIGLLFWPLPSLLLGISGIAFVTWRLARNFRDMFRLSMLRSEANAALPIEPVLPFAEPQPINWWQLFQAGFVSRPYLDKLTDETIRLSGKPWRVLQRGSLRIPVWEYCGEGRTLREKHFVRMTAYCHLIEVCTGQESPYGIILWPDSFDGVAIPKSAVNSGKLARALIKARRVLKELAAAGNIPDPPPENVCATCRLGKPRCHIPGKTETLIAGTRIPVWPERGADGRNYHSDCGDRFRWVPPHERATEKELR